MLKKVSLLLLVVIMSMFYIQSVNASQRFVDVPSSYGTYEEINYLANLGVVNGYEENGRSYYKPNTSITRGQAAKMLVISTGNKPLTVTKSSFSDVSVKTELSGYVERAVKLGLLSQYSNGKFAPNVSLTRNEMAKALSKAFNLNVNQYANLSLPFKDISKSNSYYKYISAIYYNGITKGETGTKYNPSGVVKRSQFASFIARALNEKYTLELPKQVMNVPDKKNAIGIVKITTNNLNVRSSSNSTSSSNILGKVNTGATFSVFNVQSNGWLKIDYNGQYAYIYGLYTKFLDQYGQPIESVKKEVLANIPSVTLYKNTDMNGKVLGSFSNGEKINVYQTTGNWYLTKKNGIPGYVRISQTKGIIVQEPAQPNPPQNTDQSTTKTIGMATVNNLTIRSNASVYSSSLGTINSGTRVNIHLITGNWAKISYNGKIGYINKTYLRLINQTGSPVSGRIIVLDAGHGGKDPGASSNGAVEKKIVLNVAMRVKAKLENAGAKVYMTRSGDTYPSLSDRVDFALDHYAEVFVSIHVNSASSSSAKGTETYYSISGNVNEKEDFRLASAINNQIVHNAVMVNRGVKRQDYYVVRNMFLPSVLVELGFVSNSADRQKLVDSKYVDIFANSIYKGIVGYYSK